MSLKVPLSVVVENFFFILPSSQRIVTSVSLTVKIGLLSSPELPSHCAVSTNLGEKHPKS